IPASSTLPECAARADAPANRGRRSGRILVRWRTATVMAAASRPYRPGTSVPVTILARSRGRTGRPRTSDLQQRIPRRDVCGGGARARLGLAQQAGDAEHGGDADDRVVREAP